MRVEGAGPVIDRQPGPEKRRPLPFGALLEQRMRQGVGAVRVLAAQLKGTLGVSPALPAIAGLGMRPAAIGEKPPVLAVLAGVALPHRATRAWS